MSQFFELIDQLDSGRVRQQIDELLDDLIEAVNLHGIDGELVVKLKVTKEGGRAIVVPDVKAKVPREPLGATLMHCDGEKLRRENPLQAKLDLRPRTEPEVK